MTVLEILRSLESPMTLHVGVGATPIDADFIDECGDTDLWTELEELFAVRLESL